jgi:hypothetical protein
MTRLPRAVADEALRAATLPDVILDNTREIANICASKFCKKRVRLTEFIASPAELPEPARSLFTAPAGRLDMTIGVEGYPGGKLSLLVH